MKRCPTCNRTFTDPNLVYCVEDGTPLSVEEPAEEATVVSPYRPPSYVPPPALHDKRRRRLWPWLVGLLGAFVIGAIVLLVVVAVMAPRFAKSVETNTTTDTTDGTENANAPAPTDQDTVLAQLTQIEDEWTKANIAADKKKLASILADDYVGPSPEGGLMGKAEYLNSVEQDTTIEKWEFHDIKVQLAGNRATLTGGITYFNQEKNISYNFIDRFVWRNGRWQATGSEINRKE
jgi:hypothetical protein